MSGWSCVLGVKTTSSIFTEAWSEVGTTPEAEFPFASQTLPNNELRRSERPARRRNDSSPARLTMAQAAFLNLRGLQVQSHLRTQQRLTTVSDQRPIQYVHSRSNLHENLTTSHSVPTHPQGRTDTETSVGLSAALGSDIDQFALSHAATVSDFTPFEQQLILQARLLAELDTRRRPFYNSQAAAH